MLALVEDHLQSIRNAQSDRDIASVLNKISEHFEYRSAYVVEYMGPQKTPRTVVDTNEHRDGVWSEYFSSALYDGKAAMDILTSAPVIFLDANRFSPEVQARKDFWIENDIVDCTVVPIQHGGEMAGVVVFCGPRRLTPAEQTALQIVSYNLFAQTRSFRSVGSRALPGQLTSREKEVMRLSSEGLTSQEVAERLGMSPRTVNQHVDNVAHKLGTKNRTHTVAEAIRHDLLR
ncbi:helix-turn-helix transcriptional regulator [Mesorhizobium salmacidum]|uniref:Helix-turn-helix transcriptional regulator n=1 Tax=Mesorhizobium salmacidum TaxID=3015171 RepID=A0ABU8L8B6_9HYPH